MSYRINEVFYSLQGEGRRAGEPSVFVRFSGCNMECTVEPGPKSPGGFDCDTEFVSGVVCTAEEIHHRARETTEESAGVPQWMVLTGGEPGLQVDRELIRFLHDRGWKLAIETNGSIALPDGIDWVCVSPKVAEHAIKQRVADEIRYVRGAGQGIPRTVIDAKHKYLSPAFRGDFYDHRAVQTCVELCLNHPVWSLSIQAHKLIGIP